MAFMLRSKVRTLVLSAAGAMEGFVVDTMDDLSNKVTQVGWEAAQLVCAVRTFWTAAGKPSRTMPDARTLYREAACCVTTLHGQPGAPTLYVHTGPPPPPGVVMGSPGLTEGVAAACATVPPSLRPTKSAW
jgi:hypothetical protein